MIDNNPKWKVWMHEMLQQEYDDCMINIVVRKIAEDAFNSIKIYNCDNAIYTASIVQSLIMTVGDSLDGSNKRATNYYTVNHDNGAKTYILIEATNQININCSEWLNRMGLSQNKNRICVYFSVVSPDNDVASEFCLDLMLKNTFSKIEHLHKVTHDSTCNS